MLLIKKSVKERDFKIGITLVALILFIDYFVGGFDIDYVF